MTTFPFIQSILRFNHQGNVILLCLFFPIAFQAQVTPDSSSITTRILFVFDASNSMNSVWGGHRKIETATNLLSESLQQLEPSEHLELALRVYGHGTNHVPGHQNCDDTELVVPFAEGSNLSIKNALSKLRARGTTPIARSLDKAASDFPDTPGRNVIVLITDGIEACDEDPCAVSNALQSKNILVKPFVIGMGIDEMMAETLRCIGNFYDASDPAAFEHILQLVLEQALENTTLHIDMLDGQGSATVTDIAYSFTDHRTEEHDPQWFHTLGYGNAADTIYVDPLPTYRLTIHSLPEVQLDSVRLNPGVHNVVSIPDMGTGYLTPQFARGVLSDYGDIDVQWTMTGECDVFYSSPIGQEIRLLEGNYDVTFPTHPTVTLEDVKVREGKHDVVELPAPGSLLIQDGASGFITILQTKDLSPVMHFAPHQLVKKQTLQPGDYTLLFRSRNARGTLYSIRKTFTINSGNTTYLNIHG